MSTTIGACIVTHMASGRLNNKCVAQLGGKPLLAQIILRCWELKGIDFVIACCPQDKQDDPLAEIAKAHGGKVFRGDPLNVLSRVHGAAEEFGLTHVLEISGDSPFFSLEAAQQLIDRARKHPHFDAHEWEPPPGLFSLPVMEGWGTSCRRITYYQKTLDLVSKMQGAFPTKWLEQYGNIVNDNKDQYEIERKPFKDMIIRGTPVKTSIDYPLELAIANRIIDYLGHYPKTLDDIFTAYGAIHEL